MTTWVRIAGAIDIVAALWTIWTGSLASFQVVLILLLARPMVVFLSVLASFDDDLGPGS